SPGSDDDTHQPPISGSAGVRSIVVGEAGPERVPGSGWPAEEERQALLVVLEADSVVDLAEAAARGEERRRVARAVEADDERVGVRPVGPPPLAEAVVAAVRVRQRARAAEQVDRARLAVVLREDRGARALGRRDPPPS